MFNCQDIFLHMKESFPTQEVFWIYHPTPPLKNNPLLMTYPFEELRNYLCRHNLGMEQRLDMREWQKLNLVATYVSNYSIKVWLQSNLHWTKPDFQMVQGCLLSLRQVSDLKPFENSSLDNSWWNTVLNLMERPRVCGFPYYNKNF